MPIKLIGAVILAVFVAIFTGFNLTNAKAFAYGEGFFVLVLRKISQITLHFSINLYIIRL